MNDKLLIILWFDLWRWLNFHGLYNGLVLIWQTLKNRKALNSSLILGWNFSLECIHKSRGDRTQKRPTSRPLTLHQMSFTSNLNQFAILWDRLLTQSISWMPIVEGFHTKTREMLNVDLTKNSPQCNLWRLCGSLLTDACYS